VKSALYEVLIKNPFDATLASLSIFVYLNSKSKMATKMVRKTLLAQITAMCARRQQTLENCVLYAFLESNMADKWRKKTLLAIIQSWMKRFGSNCNHMKTTHT